MQINHVTFDISKTWSCNWFSDIKLVLYEEIFGMKSNKFTGLQEMKGHIRN